MAENREINEKAEAPPSTPIDEKCLVAPLRVQAKGEPLRETRGFYHDGKVTRKSEEKEEHAIASKATTIGQSIDADEHTEHESIVPALNYTTNRRPSSFKVYKDPYVLLWTETVASEAENMHLPVPNFSHPIAISNSPPPQLPTPDLSPPYPPPAHLQHPLHRSPKTLSANLETELHSIYDLCTSKPTKPYIAHFPPPPTTAFPVPSPPQSHLSFSPPKPKQRRTNYKLEEHFPFTPLQRMKRNHRKRLYGALFAIFFVSTLGAGVGFLIHGVGDGKRRTSPEMPSVADPNGPEPPGGSGKGEVGGEKKKPMMWMVIIGGILLGFHAIFAAVMFVLYGPCGTRRKKYVRDGRGGAVEVTRMRT